ncbi:hypothetical protein GN956_G18784 [Arapaima gigas]
MALISNALAAFAFITDHPERAALCFISGVCLGLLLTLLALVVQISCRVDCQGGHGWQRRKRRRPPGTKRSRVIEPRGGDSSDSTSDSDWDAGSDLSERRRRRFERTLRTNVFTSAEELERAQRLEERERIVREIWMNGQPNVGGTNTLSHYC